MLAAALSGSFAVLVPLASVAILAVYLLVALSALVMQRRAVQPPGAFTVPTAVPVGAVLLAVWMLSNARPHELVLQAVVIVAAVALAMARRQAIVRSLVT